MVPIYEAPPEKRHVPNGVYMARFQDAHTTVLAGHGFDDAGPYLLMNDIDNATQHRFSVRGKTFTLKQLPARFCVGRFDLLTHQKSVCPLKIELLPTEKDDMCPACKEATGFNPSFYYAETISPQQRAYNETPHYVYLAYFSPQHIKAGISSETRGIERLLEQDVRAARIVGHFGNADEARKLEAALCAQPNVFETMRAAVKARLLAEEPYDPAAACSALDARANELAQVPAVHEAGFSLAEKPQDLSYFYFGGPSPDASELQMPVGHETECAGTCIGMVGDKLVMKQDNFGYVVSLKSWKGHAVDLLEGEVTFRYESAPQQISLF